MTKKLVFISVIKYFSFQRFLIPFLLYNCISREMLTNHELCDIAFFLNNSLSNILTKIDRLIMKLSQVAEYGNIQFLFFYIKFT